MGCFELSALFPKGHSDKKLEEKNNASTSGECSAKGGTEATNSGTYSQMNSGSCALNSVVSSGANSGSYVASDPNVNVEVVAEAATAAEGDALAIKLSQSGSLRKPNELRDFTYQELRYATKNFDRKNLLGEGGFGQVFKGTIKQKQRFGGGEEKVDVAVKQLNSRSQQGHKEWLSEVHFLGLVDCAFLVKLIGYCATDDDERGIQRLLVYEFMSNKGLDDHLFRQGPNCLSWASRVKIVLGAARGLAYLHEELEFQIIFRDFKTSNVLLDEDFNPKLSDFGLARQGPQDGDSHVSTAVVGTAGYAAPEYIQTGHLTVKSDVWSFGIVMLEVLTGRKVMDRNRPKNEQRLVEWAKPYINDHHKIFQIVDPLLKGRYPARPAQRFAQLAYQCLSKFPKHRPKMSDIVDKLKIVQERTYQWESPSSHSPSSLSLSGEMSRKDGLALGSLPTVRSGKAAKYSPSVRNSGGESRHIPNFSLEGSSHGSGHSNKPVSTSGADPKPVDSQPKPSRPSYVEKAELAAPVLENPEPVGSSLMKPEPVEPKSVEHPEPVEPKSVENSEPVEPKSVENSEPVEPKSLENPKPVEPKSLENPEPVEPKPVDSSIESVEPKPVDSSTENEEPKPGDSSVENAEPKPVDSSVDNAEPKPVDSSTENEEPKPVHLSKENSALVEEPESRDTVAQKPKPMDLIMENPEPMDSSAEKPKLVETVVEEEPKLAETGVEEPKLAVKEPALDPEPKLVEEPKSDPKPELMGTVVEEPKVVDAVVEDKKLEPELVEIPKPVPTDLSRENSSTEVVKRRYWGSDRLARMSRESGRFAWIPKLSFSTSSSRSSS